MGWADRDVLGPVPQELWVCKSAGSLGAKLMLTEENTRSSHPGLVAVGYRRAFFSIKMTGGGHLSAVPGTIFNF